MAKLIWDAVGEHFYETGTDHGVLYPMDDTTGKYGNGVVWNGLTGVTENPSGAESTDLWADNIKYASLRSAENFGCTIEAYTYPIEFAECDGSAEVATGVTIGQQNRKTFAFSYRTIIGNDKSSETGYKIHLVYGATASPSEKSYTTTNDSPDAVTLSWEVETTPVNVSGYKPTALVVIDSTKIDEANLKKIEDKIYGTESEEATLLLPDEIISLIGGASVSG